jgi:hypothetical protein
VNEVVPWSTRARDALAALGSRVRTVAVSGWDWFTGLGQGSWLLALGVIVALGIGVAVYQGHGDSGQNSCDQASTYIDSVMVLNGTPSLTSSQVNQLHADSTQLTALARGSAGETKRALAYVAQVSGSAQQGQAFDAGFTQGKYDSACSFSRSGPGGGPRGGVG